MYFPSATKRPPFIFDESPHSETMLTPFSAYGLYFIEYFFPPYNIYPQMFRKYAKIFLARHFFAHNTIILLTIFF